jgi:sporulation protein YlmC with PRC-barrel domain
MDRIDNPGDTGGRLIAASKVSGTAVYNTAGESLGSVYDVMLDKASGRADYAIISFGGFLGIGERYHPLPWNQLTYDPQAGGFVVNLDRDRLESAPTYAASDLDRWDDTRGTDIDTYYGTGAGYGKELGTRDAGLGPAGAVR